MKEIKDNIIEQNELVSRYVEEELDEQTRIDFEESLESSPELKREVQSLRKMLDHLDQLQPIEPSPNFVRNVRRKVRRERRSKHHEDGLKHRYPFEFIIILIVAAMAVFFYLLK